MRIPERRTNSPLPGVLEALKRKQSVLGDAQVIYRVFYPSYRKNGNSVLQMRYFSPFCLKSWRFRMGSRLGQCILSVSYLIKWLFLTSPVKLNRWTPMNEILTSATWKTNYFSIVSHFSIVFSVLLLFSYLMNTELQKMNHNAFHGQKDVHTYM